MKNKLKLLGLGYLMTGIVLVTGACPVYGEAEADDGPAIEQVSPLADEETGTGEKTGDEAATGESKEKQESTNAQPEDTAEASGNEAVQELRIWDLYYDAERDQIIGKTEPLAGILSYAPSNSEVFGSGIFHADAAGNFAVDLVVTGVNRLQASLNGRESISYDLTVEKAKSTLAISKVGYDVSEKSLFGTAEPNALIHIISSTGDKKTVHANESGYFTTTKFGLGAELVLTAEDVAGNTGEPYNYTVPAQKLIDSLKIREISYNHETKKLTLQSAPNASIAALIGKAGEAGSKQGLYQADKHGTLDIKDDTFETGSMLRLTPFLDGIRGEAVEYRISVVAEAEEAKAMTNDSEKKAAGKQGLPSTGATPGTILTIVGSLAVVVLLIMIFRKRLNDEDE